MSRICVLFLLVMLPSFFYAQSGSSSGAYPSLNPRGITVSSVTPSSSSRDQQINHLVRKYPHADNSQRQQIKKELYYLLMQTLNEKISEKEREVEYLDRQLRNMQGNPQYQNRQNEIHDLQEALVYVKRTLIYRKRNKESIVNKRLSQLIEG